MHCGPQVDKTWSSHLSWAHVELTYMDRVFAAAPVLGQQSSSSGFQIGMGLSYCSRLAFWLALLTVLPIQTGTARVSSSLSTTHHVHHFHNKHGTVPIAINRMPFLTRGGHGKTTASQVLSMTVFKAKKDARTPLACCRGLRLYGCRRVPLLSMDLLQPVHH